MPNCRIEYDAQAYEQIKQAAREAGVSIREWVRTTTTKAAVEQIKTGVRIENRQLSAALRKAQKAETAATPQQAAREFLEKIELDNRTVPVIKEPMPLPPGTVSETYFLGPRNADGTSTE